MRPTSGYSVLYLPGTIAHELCGFCYGGTLHQSNGEYSFHCALKDHNLEMLRVINNLSCCLLNETCILLTSELTKNKLRLMKTSVLIHHICMIQTETSVSLPRHKYSTRVYFYFSYFKRYCSILHVMEMRE